jgi:hypothetical protein
MSAFSISKPTFQPGDNLSLVNPFIWPDKTFRNEYRVNRGPIATGPEPWLALALLPAMVAGVDIKVEPPVSGRLLANLATIQDIFYSWENKTFHRVNIEATPVTPPVAPPEGRAVAGFFSGGVDSFYTLFRHYDEIASLVYMKNPFISVTDDALVTGRIRKAAHYVEKPVLEILPLVRAYTEPYVSWYFMHGAAMASCALLLAPQLSKAYFASTNPYSALAPAGSHPLLDGLWGTEEVEIVHDGAGATRFQKIEYVAQFEVALRHLQVCLWDLPDPEKFNCGKCYKCRITQVALRIVGKLEGCPVFAEPLDLEKLNQCEFPNYYHRANLVEMLGVLEERGSDPALAAALAATLANQKPLSDYQAFLGVAPEVAGLRHQVAALGRELATYRTALRYQLTDRMYTLLSRNRAVHRAGEILAHGAARIFK